MNKIFQSLKLSLLHVGYAKLDTSWDYDNVISPFSRLYLATEGTAKVFHTYKEIDLKPGYMYLVPSFTYSRYKCDAMHEQYYIHFLEEVGDGISIYDLRAFHYELKASAFDIKCFKRIQELHSHRSLVNEDPRSYDHRSKIAKIEEENDVLPASTFIETQALLQLLLSRFIQNNKSSKMFARSDFYELINYIKEHLHEPLNIADLAKRCNLSPDHFSRVFQQKFGIRPSKYIQTKRIERSETLLLTTNNTLAEIAEKTGWDNVSYFTRVFKKTTGQTPAKFRQERRMI